MIKHKKCRTLLVPNTYHRALRAGATYYCQPCNVHLTVYGEEVCIRCDTCKNARFGHILHSDKPVFLLGEKKRSYR